MSVFSTKQHAIMCMRLAAECRELAVDVPEPDLKVHSLRMAGEWVLLAIEPRVLH
jgi:hypothetical protein